MDTYLQAGLTAGMSATAGFHHVKPTPVDRNLNGANTLPESHCPGPKDRLTFPTKDTKTPVKASYLAIGGWPWGDKPTWHWNEDMLKDVQEAWRTLFAAGINFIDTAQNYGNGMSEEIVGRVISGIPREEVVIQTKYFPNPLGIQNYIHPVEAPVSALKQSLERMKVDYVDIYLVHGPIHPQSIASIAQGMAECVEKGFARAVGIANYNELAKYDVPLTTNQCEFSILRRWPELHRNISTCAERGIVFQGYSSLAQGRLSGKYSPDNPPPSTYRFSNYKMEDIEPTLAVLRILALKQRKSVAAVSLNYCISKGVVPVVGIKNPAQAQDAIEALGWRLSKEDMEQIDGASMEGSKTILWQQG